LIQDLTADGLDLRISYRIESRFIEKAEGRGQRAEGKRGAGKGRKTDLPQRHNVQEASFRSFVPL